MAGPSTEYLAEHLDRIREEVQAVRRDGIDGLRDLNNTLTAQFRDTREHLGEEMVLLRREVGASMETIKVDQALFRENVARLDAKTEATFARIDRTHDFLEKLLFWGVGLVVTVGGGIFWKAAQAINRLDEHGRRIELVEKEANEGQIKFRESFDKLNESQTRLGTSFDKLNESQTRLGISFDKLNDNQAKLSSSIDQLRKTIDDRLPAPATPPR